MADISKIITPNGTEYNIKDATARSDLSGKQATITASGVLIGDGSGGVTAKTLDTFSLSDDNDHVPTSGVTKSAITKVETDLASIHATGTTNATGATIYAGTWFYLNEVLVRALADIASGATFTNGTNYETVTAGALNSLIKVDTTSIVAWQSRVTVHYGVYYKIGKLVYVQACFTAASTLTDNPIVLTGLPSINGNPGPSEANSYRYAQFNCLIYGGTGSFSEGPFTIKRNYGYVQMVSITKDVTYRITGFYICD